MRRRMNSEGPYLSSQTYLRISERLYVTLFERWIIHPNDRRRHTRAFRLGERSTLPTHPLTLRLEASQLSSYVHTCGILQVWKYARLGWNRLE